jgi:hypothetical protein
MKVIKALLGALAITAISCTLLALTGGVPDMEKLPWNGGQMFVTALVVLLIYNKK